MVWVPLLAAGLVYAERKTAREVYGSAAQPCLTLSPSVLPSSLGTSRAVLPNVYDTVSQPGVVSPAVEDRTYLH